MKRANRLVRIFRALSGLSQRAFARITGIRHAVLAQLELDLGEPAPGDLDRMAREVGLSVSAGEEILRTVEALRQPRRRSGAGGEDLLASLELLVAGVYQRLLRLPLPEEDPGPQDRQRAAELWALLEPLPPDHRVSVVRVAREFQTWSLAELCCEESVAQVSRDLQRARHLARLAQEIADRVRGPESWRHSLPPTSRDRAS